MKWFLSISSAVLVVVLSAITALMFVMPEATIASKVQCVISLGCALALQGMAHVAWYEAGTDARPPYDEHATTTVVLSIRLLED
jgi:hypothetical protein